MALLPYLLTAAAQLAAGPSPESRIAVQGFGEAKAPARIAAINYELRGEGLVSDDAARALVAKAATVEAALRAIDPEIDPKASSTSIAEVRGPECRSPQNYNELKLSVGPCAVTGFVAIQRMSFDTTKIGQAATLVGVAARAGAKDPVINSLSVQDEISVRRTAIAAALADARTKAQAIAESGGFKLGPIISVTLDGARFRTDLRDPIPPSPPPPPLPQPNPVEIKFAPRPLVINAQVTVTFAIQR